MRIIKEGIRTETVEYLMTCFRCKCEFAFIDRDLKNTGDISAAYGKYEEWIECPTCKSKLSPIHINNQITKESHE